MTIFVSGLFLNPFYRYIYDATLDGFLGTVFLVSVGFMFIIIIANLVLYTQRRQFQKHMLDEEMLNKENQSDVVNK